MEKTQGMIRQGDLLFVSETLPDGAVWIEDGVLARGEATGHVHQLRQDAHNRAMRIAQVLYVLAATKAFVDHQEHQTVELPPGTWKVERQREYTPAGWRQVAD